MLGRDFHGWGTHTNLPTWQSKEKNSRIFFTLNVQMLKYGKEMDQFCIVQRDSEVE